MRKLVRCSYAMLAVINVLLLESRAAEIADLSAIAPYLDDQVLAVARLDAAQIDVSAAAKQFKALWPLRSPEEETAYAAGVTFAERFAAQFRQAGGRELYAIVSLADLPTRPPLVVAVVTPGGNTRAVAGLLFSGAADGPTSRKRDGAPPPAAPFSAFEVCQPHGNLVLAGTKDQLQRVKSMPAKARPDLAAALAGAGPGAVQAVVALPADARRVIREMLAPLPAEFGGVSGAQLADGFQWAALAIDLPPRLSVRGVIQAKDADAAKMLQRVVEAAVAKLRQNSQVRAAVPQIDDIAGALLPQVDGNRLTMVIDHEHGLDRLLELAAVALKDARRAAQRTQSVDNLKQIALAMHGYHDAHRSFPPQATFGKDGQRLLSWRVQILPFVEQVDLYRRFHLDEPWDSDHNRALIAKMPPVFASPSLPGSLASKGLTTYLVPVGDKTVFGGKEGTAIAKITDGTARTIMLVEAHPSAAVPWTKPDDLPVDMKQPLRGLTGQPNKTFSAAFCDGSVRIFSETIDPNTLRKLFQMNDGEPVELP